AITVLLLFLIRRPFPQVAGELEVAGLDARVDIVRDVDGVPHIYAETEHDLFFAQGYVHAQDRFWQMDFWRHIGAGRLSEMFGGSQVETDMFLRSLDFTGLAQEELEDLPGEHKAVLESYADGVNAYIAGRSPSRISLEYSILPLQASGYEIEPWAPVHTLTWGKVMSWDLSWNMLQEIDRANLSIDLPAERVAQLYPAYPEGHPVIVPSDQRVAGSASVDPLDPGALSALGDAGGRARAVREVTGGGFAGIGSNNWVVGGTRTETGLPILANDPHLAIQMPSIWYQNGLHCTRECSYQLAGFSFAGTPGVIIGHNDHIAWGVTNEAVDTQDLFIEKVNPANPTQYEFQGEWVEMEVRPETIVVAGGENVNFQVMVTRHGPVISDTYFEEPPFQGSALELPAGYAVSLSWQTLEPSTLVEAILGINQATGYEEFRSALAKWDIAGQNVVYADVEGNIAYQSTGEIPIRASGDGSRPVPGWTGEHEWIGTVPFEDLPRLLNPPRDYIVTANNPVVAPGSDPFYSVDSDHGYRAARIEEMIETGPARFSVATAQAMQMDNRDGGAPSLVPHLLALSAETEAVTAMQEVLASWSDGSDAFQTGPGSPGAAAYQVLWAHLLRLVFHDDLPEDSWPEGGSRWFEIVAALLDMPNDPFWDDTGTDVVEDRDIILGQAMAAAHHELTAMLGTDTSAWRWGEVHVGSFENQSFGQSGIGPLEWLFNRTAPRRLGGSADIVNAVGFYPPDGYRVDWIPSMRMVVDLAHPGSSTWINSTGQSGHAFHAHYDDMIGPWADGEQRPMRWTRDQVEERAEGTLTLSPP
ncbi:MAG TPA: penicillin acylase family protein, partial [Acidimicrobiia bacterium]|nr:penicillin acylase family protein [Acidimicrobiia bacterium]